MIIKKIISSILAVAMVAAMSTTVFAEEENYTAETFSQVIESDVLLKNETFNLSHSDVEDMASWLEKYDLPENSIAPEIENLSRNRQSAHALSSAKLLEFVIAVSGGHDSFLNTYSGQTIQVEYEDGIIIVSAIEPENFSPMASRKTFNRSGSSDLLFLSEQGQTRFTLNATFEQGQSGAYFYMDCIDTSTDSEIIDPSRNKLINYKNSSVTVDNDQSPTLPLMASANWSFTAYLGSSSKAMSINVRSH